MVEILPPSLMYAIFLQANHSFALSSNFGIFEIVDTSRNVMVLMSFKNWAISTKVLTPPLDIHKSKLSVHV
jgi:hypothetical protein